MPTNEETGESTPSSRRLIAQARKLYAEEDLELDLSNTIYALDSTTIDLCLSLFPWAPFRSHLRGNIHVSSGKLHDVNVLDMMIPEPAAIYVMDNLDCTKPARSLSIVSTRHRYRAQGMNQTVALSTVKTLPASAGFA